MKLREGDTVHLTGTWDGLPSGTRGMWTGYTMKSGDLIFLELRLLSVPPRLPRRGRRDPEAGDTVYVPLRLVVLGAAPLARAEAQDGFGSWSLFPDV